MRTSTSAYCTVSRLLRDQHVAKVARTLVPSSPSLLSLKAKYSHDNVTYLLLLDSNLDRFYLCCSMISWQRVEIAEGKQSHVKARYL